MFGVWGSESGAMASADVAGADEESARQGQWGNLALWEP